MVKFRIRRGDEVKVITGKDKGKRGKVLKVITKSSKLLVSGVNLVTKHIKPNKNSEGGINLIESPIHISNVACIDPKSDKSTKISYKFDENNKKVRIAKRSGEVLHNEGK